MAAEIWKESIYIQICFTLNIRAVTFHLFLIKAQFCCCANDRGAYQMVCRPSENFMKVYRSVICNNGLNTERIKRKQKKISLKLLILKLMQIEFALSLVEGNLVLGV